MPTSFLIGREGRAVGVMLGPARWDAPEATKLIRYYIGKGGSGAVERGETSTSTLAPAAAG